MLSNQRTRTNINFSKASMRLTFRSFFSSAVVILAFFGTSCEDSNIGIDLLGDDRLLRTAVTDQLPVKTFIFKRDSLITSSSSTVAAGSFAQEGIGTISAVGYIQPSVNPNAAFTAAADAELVSVNLRLETNFIFGEEDSPQELIIERTAEGIPDMTYYQFDSLAIAERGSVVVHEFVPGKLDTTYLDIPLPDNFGQQLIGLGQEGGYTDQDDFERLFRGFKLSGGQNNTALVGFSVINTRQNTLAANTRILLRYRQLDDSGQLDTLTYSFYMAGAGFNNYALNDAPALDPLFRGEMLSSSDFEGNGLVVSGVGISSGFTLPSLAEMQAALGNNVIINKAELFIDPLFRAGQTFSLPASLQLYQLDENFNELRNADGTFQFVFTDAFERTPRGAATFSLLSNVNGYRRVDITAYLQLLASGEVSRNIALLPSNFSSTVQNMRFTDNTFVGTSGPSAPLQERLKLIVYYTRLAD